MYSGKKLSVKYGRTSLLHSIMILALKPPKGKFGIIGLPGYAILKK
jgi:hypothetical protein